MFMNTFKLIQKNRFCVFSLCNSFMINDITSVNIPAIHTAPVVYNKRVPRSQIRFAKMQKPDHDNKYFERLREKLVKESHDEDGDDDELEDLINKTYRLPGTGHQVFVILPYIKWGENKKKNTTPQLQLEEACTLVKTLRDWKVVDTALVPVESTNTSYIFGRGNLMKFRDKITLDPNITAIFISVNMLKGHQQANLERYFEVPVFDRYTIVIQIFREHAKTREAKLQIQLAEIPYLWSRYKTMHQGSLLTFGEGGYFLSGAAYTEVREDVLKRWEAKIKKEIALLQERRTTMRKHRQRNEMPVIAVIGYTNSGKTSLIKALTGKESLQPENYLFATLDVTAHKGVLPSNLEVLYIDTVGFISDIPTNLIQSFIATLEDATLADVIIHIRDISHPDARAQNDNVLSTLQELDFPIDVMENVITVGNKIDLMNEDEIKNYSDGLILTSAEKLTGIDVLRHKIEETLLKVTDRSVMFIKVKTGSDEYHWLQEEAAVMEEKPDANDSQYMVLKILISGKALAQFKHHFIKNYSKR